MIVNIEKKNMKYNNIKNNFNIKFQIEHYNQSIRKIKKNFLKKKIIFFYIY